MSSMSQYHRGIPPSSAPVQIFRRSSEIETIEIRCLENCKEIAGCENRCKQQTIYLTANEAWIDKCQLEHKEDPVIFRSCFYEPTGIPRTQLEGKAKMELVNKFCKGMKGGFDCIGFVIKQDEEVIESVNTCITDNCYKTADFRQYLQCSLDCSKKLDEHLIGKDLNERFEAYEASPPKLTPEPDTGYGHSLQSSLSLLTLSLLAVLIYLS